MPGVSVAIVGRGQLGRAVEHALSTRGVRSRLVSRSTGFDVTAPDLQVDLGPVDVVVEATDIFTTRKEVATEFLTQSTRAVGAAARSAGARHLLVSVVGLGQPGIQRYGYFTAKAEQERVARRESTDLTVVRSTQWFEFAQQSLERMRLGPLAVVPAMTLRPVALEAVAGVVAECVVGERAGTSYDVAGPEVLTLWEMTRALPRRAAVLVPVRLPGPAGRAFRAGAMATGEGVEVVGPRFADWLATCRE